jgi:hypothetical protein
MHLTALDWFIVGASLLICFGPAVFFARRAGRSTSEFFGSLNWITTIIREIPGLRDRAATLIIACYNYSQNISFDQTWTRTIVGIT